MSKYARGRVAHATQPIDLYMFFYVTYLLLHRTDSLYYGYLVLGSFPLVSDISCRSRLCIYLLYWWYILLHVTWHMRAHTRLIQQNIEGCPVSEKNMAGCIIYKPAISSKLISQPSQPVMWLFAYWLIRPVAAIRDKIKTRYLAPY